MKFVHPDVGKVFVLGQALVPTLVIENQRLFSKLLHDIDAALEGRDSDVVLSRQESPLPFSKYAEMIVDFLHFDLNQKTLLSKVCSALENRAVSPEQYLATQELLAEIENRMEEWAFAFPCHITASKIAVSSLLKAVGVEIQDDYEGPDGEAERLVDYMELVREFDRDKLFITVNMRSYFEDDVVERFMETVVAHEYKVLMMESRTLPKLKWEDRETIDADLCEF